MSLRLRARPVLCAKCMTLCDDKAESNGKEDSSKEDNQTDKSKKENLKLSKSEVTKPSWNGKREMKGSSEIPAAKADVDPKDLCYVSVGNKRVVENYWKRPLVQPLIPSSEETYARLRKQKAPHQDSRARKRVKTGDGYATTSSDTIPNSSSTMTSQPEKIGANSWSKKTHTNVLQSVATTSTFLAESTVCDKKFPNTRSRKAQNLKMCITKLTEMRDDANHSRNENTWCGTVNNSCHSPDSYPHSDSSESTAATNHISTTVGKAKSESAVTSRGVGRRSKAWDNRIRQNSTVPVRFRDEGYLTKNIFNFNKRRPLIDGEEIPVLTICRSETANTFKVATATEPTDSTVTTTKGDDDDENDEHDEDDEDEHGGAPETPSPPQEESTTNSLAGSSTPPSPSSSSNVNEVPPNFSIKPLAKTPTIKITFGSSGHGMVVQIPPKDTQHLECSSTTEMKAARKAMKKAKKEARRKRSLSADLSPSSVAFSPNHATNYERSSPTSPVTPADVESYVVPLTRENDVGPCEPNSNAPLPVLRVTKKKKKQKKRRRSSKLFKENDGFTSSGSSHDHSVFNMSSPYSSPSLNEDCVPYGQSSPSGHSVKSCTLDSISNPDTHEPFSSFRKDTCPPTRRRSVPASSTTSTSETPQRVCINLKRIDTNAYVPLPLHSISSHSDNDDPSSLENNGVDIDDAELSEFPAHGISNGNEVEATGAATESVEFYKDKETDCTYHKGDLVWGKLPACPWWPGKIDEILTANGDDVRAKISWYKSTTQSCIRLKMAVPFAEYFDRKYTRSRRRGLYQLAVKDALVEAHKLNPEDFISPTD
ncbi:unnamed protein product [Orchesella dallaii]|uniref:PWWP domain-containing protein n=1 Tax=Orchesella dallaii TaxID=48710 RepID=A0ABP1PY00_9HEXA